MRLLTFLDFGERLFLAALYVLFAAALLRQPGLPAVSLVLVEGVAIAFVLVRRRAASVSLRPWPWLAALGATLLPIGLRPGGPALPSWAAGVLAAVGLVVVTTSKLSLNRRLGMAPANRGVQTRWTYALVRHPMYLGYFLSQAGFLLGNASLANTALLSLTWALQIVRIHQEESLLAEDPHYRAYAERVRFRLIPGLY